MKRVATFVMLCTAGRRELKKFKLRMCKDILANESYRKAIGVTMVGLGMGLVLSASIRTSEGRVV